MSSEKPSTGQNTADTSATSAERPSLGSLAQGVKLLIADAKGALQDRIALLGLELRLAAMALARLIVLAVIGVLLLATVWALLICGLYVALLLAGLEPLGALGLLLALNLVAAALVGWLAWRNVERLTLPATVRRLRESPLQEGGPVDASAAQAVAAASQVR